MKSKIVADQWMSSMDKNNSDLFPNAKNSNIVKYCNNLKQDCFRKKFYVT